MKMALLGRLTLTVCFLALSSIAVRAETILYCSEEHMAGMQHQFDRWSSFYGDEEFGRRYAIKFNDDMSELSGVQGTEAKYYCDSYFPSKAPDAITCVNSLVATMHFTYSTENKRFVLALLSPGGWLAEGTERGEQLDEYLPETIVLGQCQSF